MPVDTQQIVQEADKLGKLVAQHPAVARYRQAQKAVADDPEAGRLMAEFDKQLEALARQQQAGMQITDAQQQKLEAMQSQIVSHIKIKAMSMAQVELVDILRKISQTIHRQLGDTPGAQQPTRGAVGPGIPVV